MVTTRRWVTGLALGFTVLAAGWAQGQNYPNQTIRIVTSGAGGGNDFAARMIAPGLQASLGQPVIVDNRSATVVATEVAAKATPDGYTLHVNGANLWTTPLLQKMSYDPIKDFSPIALLSMEPSVLAVHPSLPAKSVKELIALAKAHPGELNYAAGSVGAAGHLSAELFKSMAGVNIIFVPYKTGGPALNAVVSGETSMLFTTVGLAVPQVNSGRLRALAVTSATPTVLFPGLTTVAAAGLPGYELVGRTGIWAPAKTPTAIINRLNEETVRVLNRPDVKERFLTAGGSEVVGDTPEQFAATIKADTARMGKVIKDAHIQIN